MPPTETSEIHKTGTINRTTAKIEKHPYNSSDEFLENVSRILDQRDFGNNSANTQKRADCRNLQADPQLFRVYFLLVPSSLLKFVEPLANLVAKARDLGF